MSAFNRFLGGIFGKKKVALPTAGATIDYYRNLGFFTNQTTEQVLTRHREEWGEEPKAGRPWDDVFILKHDEAKIWTGDPEADVCSLNEVYVETLLAWSKITGCQFSPSEIEETWESEEGPIQVSFLLNGQRMVLEPKYQDDWIDLEILLELNRIVKASGRRFNCAVDGNFCMVLFLTPEMEEQLRRERGFPFALP